ncbi:MAG: stage III sporulation protein AC [Clostridia bacterium]|nr:stage III sporulation protein AC [Clostridia bacterium]
MDVELIIKVAGIGMIVAVLSQVLSKAGKDDHSMLVSLAGVVVILIFLTGKIGEMIDGVRGVFGL